MAKNMEQKTNKNWLFWLGVGLLFFLFIYLIKGILLPFVLGALIAYFLNPAADKLTKWGISRTIATAIIIISFFVIFSALLLLIIPTITGQLSGLISILPSYLSGLEIKYEGQVYSLLGQIPDDYIQDIKASASSFSGLMLKFLGDMAGGIFQSGMTIISLLSMFLITPVVAFHLLLNWHIIIQKFYALLPRKHEKIIREQMSLIDTTLAGFIRGQTNVCLILGLYYATCLTLAGLKFGALIGIVTGLLVIIPYVGQIFGMCIGLIIAYFQFGNFGGILPVFAVFAIGQMLEGSIITPKLVGEKVGLHPVWIIFGMLAGASLFGFVGVLIAVPLSAVIGVLIRFATARYLAINYYRGL